MKMQLKSLQRMTQSQLPLKQSRRMPVICFSGSVEEQEHSHGAVTALSSSAVSHLTAQWNICFAVSQSSCFAQSGKFVTPFSLFPLLANSLAVVIFSSSL